MLLAITNKKTVAKMLINGSVKGQQIRDYIMNKVIGDKEGKIILMDNARSHYNKQLIADIKKTNNKIVYNVAYSPQTNPIEYMNNIVKSQLKKQQIENINGLENKLEKILNKIPQKFYNNCFKKALRCMFTI